MSQNDGACVEMHSASKKPRLDLEQSTLPDDHELSSEITRERVESFTQNHEKTDGHGEKGEDTGKNVIQPQKQQDASKDLAGTLSGEHVVDDSNGTRDQIERKEETAAASDPLGYTRDNKEFTSEIFKVQIHNLPKFGFSDLKKRLKSHLDLNPNKIKSPDRQSVAYVCFRNKEERDKALEKLNGHVWKGHKLEAKVAAPIADPYLQKKQQDNSNRSNSKAPSTVEMTAQEAEERLRGNVCPLWNMDYPKQLEEKKEKVKAVLRRVAKDNFVKWMFRNVKVQFDGMPCELLPIIPSPETSEYRNKNEFTIGYGLDGKTVVVGFRYGLYKEGITAVGDSSNLGIAMPVAIPIVKSFTEFVSQSKWKPFVQHAGTGHWQTLTVRTFRTGDVMVMVDFVPRDLMQAEIEEAKASVKEFYTSGDGHGVNIKSFYFRVTGKKGSSSPSDVQLLLGEQHVFESLMNLKFRISPEAFFQVNTRATEKLYALITEWCEASASTTVLDVCCGTGTIGLAMAKSVKEVIGIEMCSQAVEDAKANAAINGVTNATYYCSKVEDVIQNITTSIESSNEQQTSPNNVVAVVDPPRAGLHKDVIRVLRRCASIQRLVYVSCNPENAQTNFIDLIRPETGRHKGSPFTIVKAIPVDLFPGTRHCELVLLLTRKDQRSPDDTGVTSQSSSDVATDATGVTSQSSSNVATDATDGVKGQSLCDDGVKSQCLSDEQVKGQSSPDDGVVAAESVKGESSSTET